MCGRFTLRNLDNLETKYGSTDFEASYNIGPGQKLLALTDKLQSIEWGFTPYWADKPFNLVNARIETLTEKPSFSNSNRCLIPTDGWYEWRKSGENGRERLKPVVAAAARERAATARAAAAA